MIRKPNQKKMIQTQTKEILERKQGYAASGMDGEEMR